MVCIKNKYLKLFFIFISISNNNIVTIFENKFEKDLLNAEEPIIINLLTSVHPNLPWKFKALDSQIIVKPGEVTTIEYIVENLENKDTTGIATFAYFPKSIWCLYKKVKLFLL